MPKPSHVLPSKPIDEYHPVPKKAFGRVLDDDRPIDDFQNTVREEEARKHAEERGPSPQIAPPPDTIIIPMLLINLAAEKGRRRASIGVLASINRLYSAIDCHEIDHSFGQGTRIMYII